MSYHSPDFKEGYKDYVKGFESEGKSPEYTRGYEAARGHYFNDVPYDEDVLGGMYC